MARDPVSLANFSTRDGQLRLDFRASANDIPVKTVVGGGSTLSRNNAVNALISKGSTSTIDS